MQTENFTLEDLLQESYDLVVSAANDVSVCSYLKKHENLMKLIDYILKEPVRRDDVSPEHYQELQKELLLSNTAGDTISQSLILLAAVFEDKVILDRLLDSFKNYKSHIVFHRIATLFLSIFSVNAADMVDHIRRNYEGFLLNIVQQIGKAPSEDVISIFKTFLKPNIKASNLGDWLISEQLVKHLINNLKPNNSCPPHFFNIITRETVVILQELFNEALSKSKLTEIDTDPYDEFDINFSSSEDDKPPKSTPTPSPPTQAPPAPCNVLLKQFEDPDNIDLLLSVMVDSPTALAYGVPFLINLFNQTNGSADSKTINCLDSFLNILKPPISVPLEISEKVNYDKKLGFNRLAIMNYLIVLLKLDRPDITESIIKKGAFGIALDVLFYYSENTVAQHLVVEIFTLGLSKNYIADIIISSNLTQRIANAWNQLVIQSKERLENENLKKIAMNGLKRLFRNFKNDPDFKVDLALQLQILKGSRLWSYFGHLFKIAGAIINVVENNTIEDVTVKEKVKEICEDQNWKNFVELVKIYSAISVQKLDHAFDEDSESDHH